MQLDTYNLDGEKIGSVEIQDKLIQEEYSSRILQEAIVAYRNELRQGTHSTLQRSEISGSTRKLWRQKGTGRARVGSVKNPIWRHGPVVFGPQPRDYGVKINQKARRKAVRVALSERATTGTAFRVGAAGIAHAQDQGVQWHPPQVHRGEVLGSRQRH